MSGPPSVGPTEDGPFKSANALTLHSAGAFGMCVGFIGGTRFAGVYEYCWGRATYLRHPVFQSSFYLPRTPAVRQSRHDSSSS